MILINKQNKKIMEKEAKKVECCRCGDVHTKDKRIEKQVPGSMAKGSFCPECEEESYYNLPPVKPQDEETEVSDGH